MSKIVNIQSGDQLRQLISSSRIVVIDFWADWCGPCKAIAPQYGQLAEQLSRPNIITFTKVNVDEQQQVAASYGITAMPTFMIFKQGKEVSKITGAKPKELVEAVRKLSSEAESGGASSEGFSGGSGSSSGETWRGAELPRGYNDVTGEVDIRGLDLLNSDPEFGNVRTLFDNSKPTSLGNGKGKAEGSNAKPDWVESDTDEQLMLFVPFQSTLKVHTIQITSLPPSSDDDEVPMRPKTIKLYTNRAHNLGFEEADDIPATQTIELQPEAWDSNTGTAKLELRFVKFQNISSVVLFVVDGDGDGEKVRLDRIRIIGETGEKRTMGKLEKISDE